MLPHSDDQIPPNAEGPALKGRPNHHTNYPRGNLIPASHAGTGSGFTINVPDSRSSRFHFRTSERRCAGVNRTARSNTDTTRASGAHHVGQ